MKLAARRLAPSGTRPLVQTARQPGTIPDAFAQRGLADRLVMLDPGETTTLSTG